MRAGEPAASMLIILAGRVEVVDEGPPDVVIRLLRRGAALGELALLGSGLRSASARARTDVVLVEITRETFDGLLAEAPGFATGLLRTVASQLAATRTGEAAATPPRNIAVVALDPGAATDDVAARLGRALSAHVRTVVLDGGDLATVERAERQADCLLLHASWTADPAWASLCVAEADRVIAVATELPREGAMRANVPAGCELLVLGDAAAAPAAMAAVRPGLTRVAADTVAAERILGVIARRILGRSLGVVFSGGGARAFAHLGVLEELHTSGLRIDRVGGVSLGALVGAGAAADIGAGELVEAFERQFSRRPTGDLVPPVFSLVRGGRTRRLLEETFGTATIEALPLQYFCLSCDLNAREVVVHRTGRVSEAAFASLAIPGVFPPVATADGRLLVDGGVLDNLPVETMARNAEGPVIAVDVTGGRATAPQSGPRRWPGAAAACRRALTGRDAPIPYLGETIVRTLTVGSTDTAAAMQRHAHLVITPVVDGIGLLDWRAIGQARELGRQAARQALASVDSLSLARAAVTPPTG